MAKKLSVQVDYFKDYHLLGLVSHMKDFMLAFFINNQLELDLKKYDDLKPNSIGDISYSWYCHFRKGEPVVYYLIGNHHPKGKLMPAQKSLDFFLMVKNGSEQKVKEIAGKLRNIEKVTGVFSIDMLKIKDMNIIMEVMELHEMEQILKPKRTERFQGQ